MSKVEFGTQIDQEDLEEAFLTGPGSDLVAKLLMQMAAANDGQAKPFYPFQALFGPYETDQKSPSYDQQRWADYSREDWSIRSLPAINVYEAEGEQKQAPNGYLTGTIRMMVIWPANQRRSDFSRIGSAFKGAVQNFFESAGCADMLDEIYFVQRPMKVAGLNELGKTMTWTPNVEGIVEGQTVPVTIIDVNYRLDLRAWYRALEFQDRTKEVPFGKTLADLVRIQGEYDGVLELAPPDEVPQVVLPDSFPVVNP